MKDTFVIENVPVESKVNHVSDIDKLVWCADGYKQCTKCHETLPATLNYFYKFKAGKNGLASKCKECIKSEMRAKYEVEKDVILARNLAYRNADREKYNQRIYELRRANPERTAEIDRRSWYKYHEANLAKGKERWNRDKDKYAEKTAIRVSLKRDIYSENRNYKRATDPSVKLREKEWRDKNPEKIKKYLKDSWSRATPQKRVRAAIGSAIWRALKNGGGKRGKGWQELLGYTKEDLVVHLESQFVEGMSWDNYGPVWHVDHIVPQAKFNYSTVEDEDFKKCWALDNLQPLWAEENHKKGARYSSFRSRK